MTIPAENSSEPHVFWLFGLSGAGKSTLADGLAAALRADGLPVLRLDGDQLRTGLCQGLGFSDHDRAENLRRAAETAKLGVASRLGVVASFITPLVSHRRLVRAILGDQVSFIYVNAPLEVCRARDVKGLYAQARAGSIKAMTGVTAPFEPPLEFAMKLETNIEPPATSCAKLVGFAKQQLRRRP